MRLCCLGVLCPEPIDEFHQARDFALLVLVGGQQLLLVRFPLQQIVVKAPTIPQQPALPNLDDAPHNAIQEFPVVRDDQDAPRIRLQVILKPEQRRQIQVIRGLVQQEKVGLLHQQTRQVSPHHPASTQLARRPIEILLPEAQADQDLACPRFQAITAQLLVSVMHVVVHFLGMQRLGWMIRFPGLDDATQSRVLWRDPCRQLHYRLICHWRILLRQVTGLHPSFPADLPFVRVLFSQNDGE